MGFHDQNRKELRKFHEQLYALIPRDQILVDMIIEIRKALFDKPVIIDKYISYFSEKYREDIGRTQKAVDAAKRKS